MGAVDFGLFLLTAAVLALAPGPSTLLVLSHALSGDRRRPLSLMAGALLGNLLLIVVTVLGLSAVLLASQTGFMLLRWIGAAYLIWLGIAYWRGLGTTAPAVGNQAQSIQALRHRALVSQAFLTSVTNPKGLLFYFAFLPQFAPAGGSGTFLLLGGSYLTLFMAALALYALAGHRLAALVVNPKIQLWKNRLTGGLLIGAGLLLLRPERN